MASQIDALDRALKVAGQSITLRKVTGTTSQTFTDVICQANVRGYSPQELVGAITQQDSKVIISPTEINSAVWPYAQFGYINDVRVPSKNRGDLVIINGQTRTVQAAVGIYVQDVLVRIEIQVR
jgi:hypothetical protein